MRKIILIVSLLLSFVVNASLICPSTLTCNYDEGTCDKADGWHILGETMRVSFPNFFELSTIYAVKMSFPDDAYGKYKFICAYATPYNREYNQSLVLYAFTNKLTGDNWMYSGFGKFGATCSDISDPTRCAGD